MWTTLTLVLALAGCGGSGDPSSPAAPEAPVAAPPARIDVDVAALAEAHAKGVTVIDVRTVPEWNDGHVPGAIHVPLDALTPEHPAIAALPKDQPVYVVCAVGGRSKVASDLLAKAGYLAYNVDGGTNGWIAAGHPVEKPAGAAATP